jgi:hypothetical protein
MKVYRELKVQVQTFLASAPTGRERSSRRKGSVDTPQKEPRLYLRSSFHGRIANKRNNQKLVGESKPDYPATDPTT